jgi:DNA-binding CsgD family transcriptional regulator
LALIREAIAVVDPGTDPERAGLLQSRLSHYCWLVGDGLGAQEAGRAAVALVPATPPSVARARVTAALGQILMVEGFMEASKPICEEAVAVARAVGAREVEGHALNSLGTDVAYLGDLDKGLAMLAEARAIAEEVGNVDDVARAWANIVDLHNIAGRYEDTPRLALEAFAYDERHGLARFYGTAALCEGALALDRLGRWADAEAMLERLDRYQVTGSMALFVSERTAAIEVGHGDFDRAQSRLDSAAPMLEGAVDPQFTAPFADLTAVIALWQGRPGDAARAVAEGLAQFEERSVIVAGQISRIGPLYSLGIRAAADLASLAHVRHLASEAGDHVERGRGYLKAMRSMHDEIVQRLAPMVPLADGYLALCEAEATRLEGASSPERWAAAASAFERTAMRPARAYAMWREAEATLASSRARVAVAPLLRSVHALAVDMGAEPLGSAIEDLAERARVPLEVPSAPAVDAFGLTARERDVLELIAAGRTNRQIAETLFITEKTAGAHVSAILGKLGAGGRTEAAAIARRVGLVAETPLAR